MAVQYVEYNNPESVKAINLNPWIIDNIAISNGAAGRRMYTYDKRHAAYTLCDKGRDKEVHYILGVERMEHPDHSSTFGYARCPNGYCSGAFPGKYISTIAECECGDPQPQGVAPKKYYKGVYPNSNITQAYIDEKRVQCLR